MPIASRRSCMRRLPTRRRRSATTLSQRAQSRTPRVDGKQAVAGKCELPGRPNLVSKVSAPLLNLANDLVNALAFPRFQHLSQ